MHDTFPSLVRAGCLFAALTSGAFAQSTFSLDPRSTFYRTQNDAPTPPLVLTLASLGAAPGQWLLLQTTGAFININGGPDNYRALTAVFSSSSTVLGTSLQHRVPGAIAAGPSFTGGTTWIGNLPMDIPEDFFVSRYQWGDYVRVEVPAGATHLLIATLDSLYLDNVDPNGDWDLAITVLPTPALPGTGENLELRTGVSATPSLSPEVKLAGAGTTMSAEVRDALGLCADNFYAIVGDTMATGGTAPSLLPRLWADDLVLLASGIVPATQGWVATWSMVTPPGLLGVTLIVQGGAVNFGARNGLFETSTAHRFELQ